MVIKISDKYKKKMVGLRELFCTGMKNMLSLI